MSLHFDLVAVPHGKNLDRIGWSKGYLMVIFKGRPDRYIYGKDGGIAEIEKHKILANPFPDALFSKMKKHWKCHKISGKMVKSGVTSTGKASS